MAAACAVVGSYEAVIDSYADAADRLLDCLAGVKAESTALAEQLHRSMWRTEQQL
eukprot:gene7272-7485_t